MANDSQITTAQALTQAVVNVAVLNIFAQALGIMVAGAGAVGVTKAPAKLKPTEPGIQGLRDAFGSALVDKALAEVPAGADIVTLAKKVEELVHKDLIDRYGQWEAATAIQAAPPGDLRTAREIAQVLKNRGVTPASPREKVVMAAVEGRARGRAKAKPVRDTKTSIVYRSESGAAKAVAKEYGLDPEDHFAWYKIIKIEPGRFVRV